MFVCGQEEEGVAHVCDAPVVPQCSATYSHNCSVLGEVKWSKAMAEC